MEDDKWASFRHMVSDITTQTPSSGDIHMNFLKQEVQVKRLTRERAQVSAGCGRCRNRPDASF